MPQSDELLPDPYKRFGYFDDDYPKHTFEPLHPKFIRKGRVHTSGKYPREYYVDLALGECNCEKGVAWRKDTKTNKWFRNSYCSHKLRALSSLTDAALASANDSESLALRGAYIKALGTRYNPFELVSAFHKELRRGDFEAAWFFGILLTSKRSIRGVFDYLINILYEETRDHELGQFLLEKRLNRRAHTFAELSKAISFFCSSTKKWQIPRRFTVFQAEMHGYNRLVKEFGRDVAKGSNIIPVGAKDNLLRAMRKGALNQNEQLFQYGLKGLQKLQYLDHYGDDYARNNSKTAEKIGEHRYWLYCQLYDLAEKLWSERDPRWQIFGYVNERIDAGFGTGYHELNCLGDALLGEPYDAGLLSLHTKTVALNRPAAPIILGKWPQLPLYAFDNHVWGGKSLIRRFPEQLKPKAVQTDLDLRWCGAYFGVAYRYVAFSQHGDISEWHNVEWPKDLYGTVNSLWY